MSSHSVSRTRKCWTCAYYGCKREIKHFFGASVECEYKGICSNDKCRYYGKTVREDDYCDHHALWGIIESEIANEEAKKAAKKAEKEESRRLAKEKEEEERRKLLEHLSVNRENSREEYYQNLEKENRELKEIKYQREQLEIERKKLEEDRKKLEYDKWYMSLSEDERKKEDERIRIEKEKEEKEAKIRKEKASLQFKEASRRARRKHYIKLIAILSIAIIIIILFAISLALFINAREVLNKASYRSNNYEVLEQDMWNKFIFFMCMLGASIILIVVSITKLVAYFYKKRRNPYK